MSADFHPKKSLGQNFLVDGAHLARIVAAADLTPTDQVLEIGPGQGVLTQALAAQAARVVAVELDDRLIEPLRTRFAGAPHVAIVHGDILALDPAALMAQEDAPPVYKVVANLPYYITSAVLRHLLEASPAPSLAVVLVQLEVAQRICAAPGDLSLLAVSVQYYARPRLVSRCRPAPFAPRPRSIARSCGWICWRNRSRRRRRRNSSRSCAPALGNGANNWPTAWPRAWR
jgi:16S rRNA (adenine1518-N6/adenine1519-N6)-dimethyltransferase